jgi:hypothetical protein
MSIIDCEKRAPRPLINLLELRLNNIEYYRYPILIIVPDNPLVSIRSIATDHAILLAGELGWVVAIDVPLDLLLLHLHVFLLLLHRHYKASIGD